MSSEEIQENNSNNIEEKNTEKHEENKEKEIVENKDNEKKDYNNSFKNDLWEGTKKIYDRYDAGKKTLTDMISIFKMRAEGEEKFIKDMNLISNKTHSLREGGTYGTAWLDIRNSHKELSKTHTNVLESIRKDIIAPLEQFKKEKQQTKERLNNEEKNLNHQLKSGKEKVENCKEKYLSLSDQAELALLNLKKARNDPSFDKKKMVKLEENNNRLSSESIKAHEQYKQTLSELNIFQKKYEQEMHKILESLQEIEEERLTFVKQILDKYLEITDKHIIAQREIHTSITKGVVAMDSGLDLKNWIDSNKTGIESKEILIEYVPYVQKYGNDVSTIPKPKNSLLSKLGFGKKKKTSTKESTSTSNEKVKVTSVPSSTNKQPESKPPKEESGSEKKRDSVTSDTPNDVEVVEVKKAKALFEFNKTEENELSFKIGDIVNITRVDDSGWWEAELNGEIGLVPGNYLQLLGEVEDDHSEDSKSKDSGEFSPKKEKEEPKKEPETKKEEPKKEPETKKEEPRKEPEPKKELPQRSDEPKKEETQKEEPKKEPEPKKEEPKKEEPKKEPEPEPETKKEEPKKEPEPENEEGGESVEEDNHPIGKSIALYDFPGNDEDELTVRAGETVIIYSQVEGWCTGTNEAGEYGMVPGNYLSPMEKI